MFGHTTPLRTLNVHDHGSSYTILDTDEKTLLYTIHWNANSAPHMTVYRGDDLNDVAGTATYEATKKLGFTTASNITLQLPSGEVSLNKEGGLISTDKRTLRSAALGGEVYWQGGNSMTGSLKLVDGKGKRLVEYKARRVTSHLGTLEIDVELGQEGLDEVVVSGIAMLSEEMTSMDSSAAALSTA